MPILDRPVKSEKKKKNTKIHTKQQRPNKISCCMFFSDFSACVLKRFLGLDSLSNEFHIIRISISFGARALLLFFCLCCRKNKSTRNIPSLQTKTVMRRKLYNREHISNEVNRFCQFLQIFAKQIHFHLLCFVLVCDIFDDKFCMYFHRKSHFDISRKFHRLYHRY